MMFLTKYILNFTDCREPKEMGIIDMGERFACPHCGSTRIVATAFNGEGFARCPECSRVSLSPKSTQFLTTPTNQGREKE